MAMGTVRCIKETEGLRVGKNYEVVARNGVGDNEEYYLLGLEGSFPAANFKIYPQVYLAVSNTVPKKGGFLKEFSRMKNHEWETVRNQSIKSVEYIGNDIYAVKTENCIYMMQVM